MTETRAGTTVDTRLTPDMISFIRRMHVAVVATTDRGGECDSSLRAGPPGFIRVLDDRHVAYPEYRGNGVMGSLGNLQEVPDVGLLMVDFTDDRTTLQVGGPAETVTATDMRSRYPWMPEETAPGRRADVWVLIEVTRTSTGSEGEVPHLVPLERERAWGTDDVGRKGGDFFGAAAEASEPAAGAPSPASDEREPTEPSGSPDVVPAPRRPEAPVPSGTSAVAGRGPVTPSSPTTREPWWRRPRALVVLVAVLAVLVLLLAGVLVAVATSRPAAAPPPPPGPTGPPTLYGRVVDVPSPSSVVVDVAGTRVTVDVLGVDGTALPACAAAGAEEFARRTLSGRTVTVVPDPTVVATEPRQAYVVLPTQLSYTDAAVRAGWAVPGGTALYRPSFDEGHRAAEDDEVGMFGPACRR